MQLRCCLVLRCSFHCLQPGSAAAGLSRQPNIAACMAGALLGLGSVAEAMQLHCCPALDLPPSGGIGCSWIEPKTKAAHRGNNLSSSACTTGALLSLDNVAEAMQLRYCLAWVLRPLCSELGPAPAYQREFGPQMRASLFTALLAATDPGSPEKGIVGEHAGEEAPRDHFPTSCQTARSDSFLFGYSCLIKLLPFLGGS